MYYSSLAGETSLHLAARYGCTDAAQSLVEDGADVNVQAMNGRTPLHSAVAADAQGVLKVKIIFKVCDLQLFYSSEIS